MPSVGAQEAPALVLCTNSNTSSVRTVGSAASGRPSLAIRRHPPRKRLDIPSDRLRLEESLGRTLLADTNTWRFPTESGHPPRESRSPGETGEPPASRGSLGR